MADHPASIRDGRYAVVGVLGEGAQAQTLAAVDKLHGRSVAIKRFVVRGARSWKDVELAEREARVLGSLQHPNLPGYVEHFEEGGDLYLVMDQIEGESLQQLKKRGARLQRVDVLRLLSEIGAVLGYLHGHNPPIIHRDIKPGNVIRRPNGGFALVDFGSVRDHLKPEGGSTVVGTFGYMAPEQFQGRALPQTDAYALGATVLSVVTGEEPENLPHRGLMLDVARALPQDPELAGLIARLVEPDPDRRATDVLPLLRGLGSQTRHRPGPAQPQARVPRAFEPDGVKSEVLLHAAHRRGEPLPPALLMVCLIGLQIARSAVRLAVGLLVPMLLLLLSVLFGHGLRRAARQVRATALRADNALVRARRLVERLEIAPEPFAQGTLSRPRASAQQTTRGSPRVVPVTAEALDPSEAESEALKEPRIARHDKPGPL